MKYIPENCGIGVTAEWLMRELRRIADAFTVDKMYYAYNTSTVVVTTSFTAIPVDTEVKKDRIYSHDGVASPTEITILEKGWYDVTFEGTADTGSGANNYYAIWRAETYTAAWVYVTGAQAASYHKQSAGGYGSCSINFLYEFDAGEKLRFTALSDTATNVSTVVGSCRIKIRKINE